MRQFNNVLLVAGSRGVDSALIRRVSDWTRTNSVRVTIAVVVPDQPRHPPGLLLPLDLEELSLQEARGRVEKAVKALGDRQIDVSVAVLQGIPFVEIIRKVIRDKHDLVMLSYEKTHGLKGRFLGSLPLHLMRKCPCPVWVLKPGQSTSYARILAAVDPSSEDEEKTALNQKILELAVSLAEAEQGQLHIVHAWSLYGESTLRGTARTPKKDVDELVQKAREAHKAELAKLLEPFALAAHLDRRIGARPPGGKGGVEGFEKARVHFLKGPAASVIEQVVRKEHIEVIVMGTVSRTGVSGFLIGNTAETVLGHVDCSILTLKPRGFVTPVTLE